MTREEAIRACLAMGTWREPECVASVDDRMVDGVYCDGSILVDATGSRCIAAETVERVERARATDPPPTPEADDHTPVVAAVVILALLGLMWDR